MRAAQHAATLVEQAPALHQTVEARLTVQPTLDEVAVALLKIAAKV